MRANQTLRHSRADTKGLCATTKQLLAVVRELEADIRAIQQAAEGDDYSLGYVRAARHMSCYDALTQYLDHRLP